MPKPRTFCAPGARCGSILAASPDPVRSRHWLRPNVTGLSSARCVGRRRRSGIWRDRCSGRSRRRRPIAMKKVILTATMFALVAVGPQLWAQTSESVAPDPPQRMQKRARIHVAGAAQAQGQQQGPAAQSQALQQQPQQWQGRGRGPRAGVGPGTQCPRGMAGMQRQRRQGCCGQQARMGRGLRGGRGR
jgi:hypothetical protein